MRNHRLSRFAPLGLVTLLLGTLLTVASCVAITPAAVQSQLAVAPALLSAVVETAPLSSAEDAPVTETGMAEEVAAMTTTLPVTVPKIISSGAQITAETPSTTTAVVSAAMAPTAVMTMTGVVTTSAAVTATTVATPSLVRVNLAVTDTQSLTATLSPTLAALVTYATGISITESLTGADVVTSSPPLTTTAAMTPAAPVSPTTVIQRIAVITTDRLNVRSGPGVENEVVFKLLRNDRVPLVGEAGGGWYEVRLPEDGGVGWISAAFADLVEEEIALEDAPPALAAAVTAAAARNVLFDVRILADRLNVRAEPGLGAAVTAKLLQEDLVPVVGATTDAEWYEVLLADGGTGWIAATYAVEAEANTASEADVETDADADANAATDTEANADVDTEADAETDAETDADSADAERDVGTNTDDASTSNGSAETAAASAVDDVRDTEAAPAPVAEPTAVTQPERMNVRSGPGTGYPVLTNVAAGSALPIVAKNPGGDWYQIRLPESDDLGWVYGPLVETRGPVETVEPLPEEEVPALPETPAEGASPAPAAAVAASAPPPSGAGFFGYGVQAHMLGGGIDAATNATAAMGFNWLKQQVEWRVFEGAQGQVDFSELRRIVDAAGGRGISVLFSVVNAPDWAREPGFDASVGGPPADPQTYAAFVGRLAGEFCGSSLRAIEVWNEQNLHYEWGNKPLNPAEYMNLLRAAYGSIKAACPSMLVISGALTPAGDAGPYARDDFAYLEGMYQNGLANYADGIGAHPSGYNVPPSVGWQEACGVIQQTGNFFNGPCDTPHHSWSFRSTMEGYRNIMIVYGDANKRLWPTEFGWAAGGMLDPRYAYAEDNSFEEQAAWTVEAFQMMRNWGWVGPAFLWNLNFRVVADGTEKAQWGIVRNDYSPLPVYSALQAMPK